MFTCGVLSFQSEIEALIRKCRHPPLPDAVCRYPDCLNKLQIYQTDPGKVFLCLKTGNQILEKCIQCVLLLYNWYLSILWLTTYYTHGHNLVLLKFTIKQLVSLRIDTSITSSLCVTKSKMVAKA